ncbi:MAG: hypothetical protein RLZZ184_4145 [Cyanobacteriota bacterium]|jgi:nucleoside-diphosphate-sugar epimerase
MKIFVTGGTGFIGSHFVMKCLAEGHSVRALRRAGSKPRVQLDKHPEWLEYPFEKLEEKDFDGCDVLVHLAAHSANVPYDSLENCLHWNVTIPLRMADRAVKSGIKRFIVAGSCFEYGSSGQRYDYIPTTAPLEPNQTYPTSKAAATIAWAGFAREKALKLSILRIFQVYGEGEAAGRLWPSILKAALDGDDYNMTLGEQVRDFINVKQVAQYFVDELKKSPQDGVPSIQNVGTGKPQTVASFAKSIWKKYNATGKLNIGAIPYRNNEVMRFVPKI